MEFMKHIDADDRIPKRKLLYVWEETGKDVGETTRC